MSELDVVGARALVDMALRRAFVLGQEYWQRADSQSHRQNKLADETRAKFDELVTETLAAIGGKA